MRQRVAAAAAALAVVLVLATAPAAGQTTTAPEGVDPAATGILPQPDSGAAPDEPGDRGGWAQVAVFALVVAGVLVVAALAARNARRVRPRPGPS